MHQHVLIPLFGIIGCVFNSPDEEDHQGQEDENKNHVEYDDSRSLVLDHLFFDLLHCSGGLGGILGVLLLDE